MAVLATIAAAAEGQALHGQASGIGALGLNVPALLFQVLNFIILLVVLRVFAYPAILRVLEVRRSRIAEGLRTADELEAERIKVAAERTRTLQAAQAEAQLIIDTAQQQAENFLQAAHAKAQQDAEASLAEAKRQIDEAVRVARRTLQAETTQLVVAATEKVLAKKVSSAADMRLIKKAIEESPP